MKYWANPDRGEINRQRQEHYRAQRMGPQRYRGAEADRQKLSPPPAPMPNVDQIDTTVSPPVPAGAASGQAKMEHRGFGRFFIVGPDGADLSGPHTKAEAAALVGGA